MCCVRFLLASCQQWVKSWKRCAANLPMQGHKIIIKTKQLKLEQKFNFGEMKSRLAETDADATHLRSLSVVSHPNFGLENFWATHVWSYYRRCQAAHAQSRLETLKFIGTWISCCRFAGLHVGSSNVKQWRWKLWNWNCALNCIPSLHEIHFS